MSRGRPERHLFVGILAAGVLLASPRAAAQCTLTAPPAVFEPSPPGASRPWELYAGHNNDVQLYGVGSSRRLLMMESFGYSVLDLSNPASPTALLYDDLRFDANPVSANGDGQAYISSMGVAPDGQRMAFSLNSNANASLNTVVGAASGQGAAMTGDFLPRLGSGGTVIQHVGNRYIAYVALPYSSVSPQPLYAADVTNLPSSLSPQNVPSENAGPGGYNLTLAGNFLVYVSGATIRVLDASAPGPVGHITSSYPLTVLSATDLGLGTQWIPYSLSSAVDPVDSTKVWVLAEMTPAFGQPSQPPRWVLASVKGGVKTLVGAPYQVVAGNGETWGPSGVSALIPAGGSLVTLMWGFRSSSPVVYRLFSSSLAGWGTTNSADVNPAAVSGTFSLRSQMHGFAGAGNSVYAYLATGNSAYALSLSCITVPAPPVDSLAVSYATCPGSGSCALNPGDPVFVGTQLQATLTAFALNAPTDWRFDYDWHQPAEDNGSSPRIKFPDLSYPASGATPPATVTFYGPCDPRSGGTPSTGAGCWSAETSNGDFSAGASAGTTSSLQLALEAANVLGAGNTATFPLTWKIPAVRLLSPNILLSQPLQSASDGTPSSTGFKWYFGTTPTSLSLSSCTGASCVPPAPFNVKGTYYYWLTVPYPTGYTSPDCGSPCTANLGSFSITDVSLSFSGVATTVVAGSFATATDGSTVASGVTSCGGGLQYSLCDASSGSCAAGTWQSLTLLNSSQGSTPLGTGGTGTITTGSVAGSFWLRIRYSYTTTGSCTSPLVASWVPAVSGLSDNTAWPITVTPAPPSISVQVNGANPCAGPGGLCSGGIPANIGDIITYYAIINNRIDPSPPAATLWSFGPSASPATCAGTGCQGSTFQFTGPGTFTITLTGYAIATSLTFVVAAPPVSASNGGAVCAGSTLSLFASPTIAGATYAWTGPSGFTSTQQNPTISFATSGATGTYTVVRTYLLNVSRAYTTVTVNPSPGMPTAGSNTPLCAGQTLALTAATVAGATYTWTGPNGFASTLQNPTLAGATAAASGTYAVTASVGGCFTAASTGVTVNGPPAAPFAGNSGPICSGGTLSLTASTISNASYRWTGPNGFSSSAQNPTIPGAAAAAAGLYSVVATVNGCAGPAGTTTAVVNAVSASISAPSQVCLTKTTTGTASVPNAGTGATYAWNVTNGSVVSGQGTSSIVFQVAGAGTTTLGVTVTAGSCSASGSVGVPATTVCGGLYTLTPCRIVDTRNAPGAFGAPSLPASSPRLFVVAGACGIPAGVSAISANVTVTNAAASGTFVVYPGDLPAAPNTSTLSFQAGQTRANNAMIKLASDGSGSFAVENNSPGTADLIVDVNGYFP